jgi:hypothetical protein
MDPKIEYLEGLVLPEKQGFYHYLNEGWIFLEGLLKLCRKQGYHVSEYGSGKYWVYKYGTIVNEKPIYVMSCFSRNGTSLVYLHYRPCD